MHTNSGVNNKAAFLMTDGGTFNGQTITGIGINKVKRIYYVVDNSLLGSASDYQNLGNALRQACSLLAGSSVAGITTADCAQVNKAVLATEMDKPPAMQPSPTDPPACTSPDKSSPTLTENFENSNEVDRELGDDSGNGAWFYPGDNNPFGFDATYATSGTRNLWGYDQSGTSDGSVVRTAPITVPTLGSPRLRWAQSYGFDADPSGTYDGGVVEISIDNGNTWSDASGLFLANGYSGTIASGSGNPLAGRHAFVGESGGYETSMLNLAPLAGKSILIRFRMGTDQTVDDFGWFIDDFQVYSCKNTVAPDTRITKAPKKVKTKRKVAKVKFKFTGSDDVNPPQALSFQCDFGDGTWQACRSPLKAKAKARKGKGASTGSRSAPWTAPATRTPHPTRPPSR